MPDIALVNNSTVGPLNASQAVGRTSGERTIVQHQPAEHTRQRDRVEVSHHANWLQAIRDMPEVRQDRINAVQTAIQDNSYVTPEKIDQAVKMLMKDILE
ncbi:MAG: flagellar biosynthesis anti-sigma factor FlgM [Phycisphaerales bacterium]|nr:flagellar biosynthesis anti-sigma factor FlgM [Phycisphaerales bacterium]